MKLYFISKPCIQIILVFSFHKQEKPVYIFQASAIENVRIALIVAPTCIFQTLSIENVCVVLTVPPVYIFQGVGKAKINSRPPCLKDPRY